MHLIQTHKKYFFKSIFLLLMLGLTGTLLLAMAFMLPTGRIKKHVKDAFFMLEKETNYFSVTPGTPGTQQDNYTEALYLNEAMVGREDAGIWECVFSGYSYLKEENLSNLPNMDPSDDLNGFLSNPDETVLMPMSRRFFNGYEIILKPMLIVMSYSSIRTFNLFALLFLTLLLFYLMDRKGMRQYIMPTILAILYINPLSIALNMTFFGFYCCMIIPCIILLRVDKEWLQKKGWILFEVIGACAFYFNMNYFQLLSFGMPLLFYFMVTGLPETPVELIKRIASLFIPWCIGYAGMMAFKWIMYTLIVDNSIIREVIDSILVRSDTDHGSRLRGIYKNIKVGISYNKLWDIAELVFIGWLTRKFWRIREKVIVCRTEILLLSVMILMPVCRYILFPNHVIIHKWVTYRLLMIPILTFNLLAVKAIHDGFRRKLSEDNPGAADGYILDVDGTLYSQTKLRCAMIWRLLKYYILRPLRFRELLIINSFRKVRNDPENKAATIDELYGKVAVRTRLPESSVAEVIQKWMFEVPLDLIRRYAYKELTAFINHQHMNGKKVAVYSDYPAEDKVKAAGLECDVFFISNCGGLTEQKPSPSDAGLILDTMELSPASILYIGDREDKDKASADLMKVRYCDVSFIRELIQFADDS